MISEVSVAMAAGMGLGTLASVIHPYPTQASGTAACQSTEWSIVTVTRPLF